MGDAEVNTLWLSVCEADDQSAFRALFDYYYNRLVRFAADLAGTREAAEEIVSDVFVQLWKNRRQTAGVIRLKTYLYTAVRHRSYNYIRDHQQHQWLDLDSIEEPAETAHQPSLEWKELRQQLDAAVDRLSPQCRTVFRMVREEGFKYKEVAAILDVSPRTVETQLVRAVARLREVLQTTQHPVR